MASSAPSSSVVAPSATSSTRGISSVSLALADSSSRLAISSAIFSAGAVMIICRIAGRRSASKYASSCSCANSLIDLCLLAGLLGVVNQDVQDLTTFEIHRLIGGSPSGTRESSIITSVSLSPSSSSSSSSSSRSSNRCPSIASGIGLVLARISLSASAGSNPYRAASITARRSRLDCRWIPR